MVEQLAAGEADRRLRAGSPPPLLVDVREADERALASIEPSVHIPMHELPRRLHELPRDRALIVYCHTGVRSQLVAGFLEQNGFQGVANLRGGIDAWSREVDATVARYG